MIKFAGWLASPLPLVLLGALLALLLAWRGWRRAGWALATSCLAGLWLASTPWLACALTERLERQYPPVAVDATPVADAVVVLGGAVAAAQPPHRPQIQLSGAADRVWHAGQLFRAGKARWLILVGGNQPGFDDLPPEAEAMREMLRVMGVPERAMRLETRSRNTDENAAYSLQKVQQTGARRVLLVTSALHMPRAMAVFQAAWQGTGITLVPAATDAQALGHGLDPVLQWLPDAGSLALSSRVTKEYLGLARIWVVGGRPAAYL